MRSKSNQKANTNKAGRKMKQASEEETNTISQNKQQTNNNHARQQGINKQQANTKQTTIKRKANNKPPKGNYTKTTKQPQNMQEA